MVKRLVSTLLVSGALAIGAGRGRARRALLLVRHAGRQPAFAEVLGRVARGQDDGYIRQCNWDEINEEAYWHNTGMRAPGDGMRRRQR